MLFQPVLPPESRILDARCTSEHCVDYPLKARLFPRHPFDDLNPCALTTTITFTVICHAISHSNLRQPSLRLVPPITKRTPASWARRHQRGECIRSLGLHQFVRTHRGTPRSSRQPQVQNGPCHIAEQRRDLGPPSWTRCAVSLNPMIILHLL